MQDLYSWPGECDRMVQAVFNRLIAIFLQIDDVVEAVSKRVNVKW